MVITRYHQTYTIVFLLETVFPHKGNLRVCCYRQELDPDTIANIHNTNLDQQPCPMQNLHDNVLPPSWCRSISIFPCFTTVMMFHHNDHVIIVPPSNRFTSKNVPSPCSTPIAYSIYGSTMIHRNVSPRFTPWWSRFTAMVMSWSSTWMVMFHCMSTHPTAPFFAKAAERNQQSPTPPCLRSSCERLRPLNPGRLNLWVACLVGWSGGSAATGSRNDDYLWGLLWGESPDQKWFTHPKQAMNEMKPLAMGRYQPSND